ncbi:hypothetical protein GGR57DRAFT_513707 [Xylariaceae sp. FL1272]|nr:hypothetical protein GGR57DRAFT_513707 [Xylariaceae sp. FL1272]
MSWSYNKPDILVFSERGLSSLPPLLVQQANCYQARFNEPGEPEVLLNQYPAARAALIATCDILRPELENFSRQLVRWVKESGGRVVLGAWFMASILNRAATGEPGDVNAWFADAWGLPWEAVMIGTVHLLRKDTHQGPMDFNKYMLPESFETEAMLLENVAVASSLYTSDPQKPIYSSISGRQIEDTKLTGVALTQCGYGWLGYTGDTAGTWQTTEIMLAMLGNVGSGLPVSNDKNPSVTRPGDHVPDLKGFFTIPFSNRSLWLPYFEHKRGGAGSSLTGPNDVSLGSSNLSTDRHEPVASAGGWGNTNKIQWYSFPNFGKSNLRIDEDSDGNMFNSVDFGSDDEGTNNTGDVSH